MVERKFIQYIKDYYAAGSLREILYKYFHEGGRFQLPSDDIQCANDLEKGIELYFKLNGVTYPPINKEQERS